jgi:serine-type D-Ala-D-Ala carboxypeptidase/endopeptidase (penicillin-binding protein 4)
MNYSQAAGPTNFFPFQNNVKKSSQAGSRGWLADIPFAVFSLILLLCCLPGCAVEQPSQATSQAAPDNNDSTPLHAPVLGKGNREVADALNALLDSREYASARWGVAIASLRDGKLMYERNGDKAFTPASNMKIYTTAVALDLLGSDYRWRTSVYSEAEPDSNGVVPGDLILYGKGAPDLLAANRKDNQNSLEELAIALTKRGVKRVAGNVIGDESYFRGEPIGIGWQWNDLQWYFGAEASALTINANAVEISITQPTKPGDQPKVATDDGDGFVQVRNNMAAAERGGKYRIGIQRGLSDNKVIVWGEMPPGVPGYGANLSVHQPALWASRLFVRALNAHGIMVDGSAMSRDWRVPENERFDPQNKLELAHVDSESLGELVRVTNKHSVNLYAELILRTLGRERAAMLPVDAERGRERGDDEAGIGIVQLWLSRSGVKTAGIAIHDGSGLSRLDLVTPETTVGLLQAIHRASVSQIFIDSLPIAGTDGTLQGRLQELKGKLAAKTGALTYDNSLSGYLTLDTGEVLVFSIMCNDSLGKGGAIRLIDQLISTLAKVSTGISIPERLK